MNNSKLWWSIALIWCFAIAIATRQPFFTGDSTKQLLLNPFFDSAILNYVLRKATHLTAFGLLALFLWLALRGSQYRYFIAWLLASIYGAIDEWHQSFLPNRSALVTDVLIDSLGAFLMLIFIYWINKRKTIK
ncbi:VanZ family protein [Alkalihalobacillus deserti]|uniref:VanZ family protein n=1 Tax=Alkalihalobacillus deserti TaxID=2879466 RepID=UPI001D15CB64|nr:VanZ family protein [Alkalihalobacillus deserti]